jgi:hypothetical protein
MVCLARHQRRGGPDGRAGRRLRDVSAPAISPEQPPQRARDDAPQSCQVDLLDEAALAVQVAGSCNAILRRPDGSLYGDLFDGIGFVREAKRKGFDFTGADCLIVGAGGVGSAIAAAIAAEGPGSIALCDIHLAAA